MTSRAGNRVTEREQHGPHGGGALDSRAYADDRGRADGPVNGTSPVVMACSTLYISTGGGILRPRAAPPPPPAANAARATPTASDTVPRPQERPPPAARGGPGSRP